MLKLVHERYGGRNGQLEQSALIQDMTTAVAHNRCVWVLWLCRSGWVGGWVGEKWMVGWVVVVVGVIK